jgi:hypothetical protein
MKPGEEEKTRENAITLVDAEITTEEAIVKQR